MKKHLVIGRHQDVIFPRDGTYSINPVSRPYSRSAAAQSIA